MSYTEEINALSPIKYWRLGESSGTTGGSHVLTGTDIDFAVV